MNLADKRQVITLEASPTRALAALGKLPPFSPILSKLMASLAGSDASFSDLGDLIEKDTVIAANVLRVVNSAAYSRRAEVTSVRRALSVLGIEKIRNMVLAMSVSRMLNQAKPAPGFSMERFNKHSAAVAMLSDLLAQHAKSNFPEGAFVAGLLHDVGRLLIAMALPQEFVAIQRLYQSGEADWVGGERQVLGFTHAALSADALAQWKLPDEVRQAVFHHHHPLQPGSLAAVLGAANQVVNALGHTVAETHKGDDANLAVLESLGFTPATAGPLLDSFEREYSAIGQFYQ